MSRIRVLVAVAVLSFAAVFCLSDANAQPPPKKGGAAAAHKAAAPAARPAAPPRAAAPAARIAAPPRAAAPVARAAPPPPRVAAPSRPAFQRQIATPSQTLKSAPVITRDQSRQQVRELQAKQHEELRGKNLKPAERQQLRVQQREQLRDLQVKQREQRNVGPDTQQAGVLKNDVQTRLQDRQQLRELQAKQWQELRNRNLSPAERRQLIAKQHEEFRALRAEQVNRRLGIQQQQQTQQQQQQTQQQQKQKQQAQQLRPDGKPRVTADAARSGRFAALVQNDPNLQARHAARIAARVAARQAWRQGRRAAFVAWVGPVFYPYAYSDILEFTFWPYAYDDAYWAYVYDDFVDSIFWGDASPYSDYAYYGPSPRSYSYGNSYTTASAPSGRAAPPRSAAAAQVCSDPGKGITAWPFAQIEQAVRPNAEQRRLLEDVKHAAAGAAETFKASCAQNFPLTPPGRLAAMTSRLDATLQAVRTVRPALEAFYNSLSDEQKAHFTAIGPDIGADQARRARSNPQQDAKACGGEKQGLTNLPIERIEDAVQPTQAQQGALDRLGRATAKAVEFLAAACPDFIPLTPVGRLEAMEKRLEAMVRAGKTVQPALEEFYASLSHEQKARFNTLGQQVERSE